MFLWEVHEKRLVRKESDWVWTLWHRWLFIQKPNFSTSWSSSTPSRYVSSEITSVTCFNENCSCWTSIVFQSLHSWHEWKVLSPLGLRINYLPMELRVFPSKLCMDHANRGHFILSSASTVLVKQFLSTSYLHSISDYFVGLEAKSCRYRNVVLWLQGPEGTFRSSSLHPIAMNLEMLRTASMIRAVPSWSELYLVPTLSVSMSYASSAKSYWPICWRNSSYLAPLSCCDQHCCTFSAIWLTLSRSRSPQKLWETDIKLFHILSMELNVLFLFPLGICASYVQPHIGHVYIWKTPQISLSISIIH